MENKKERSFKIGEKVIIDGYLDEPVIITKMNEPDKSFETGRTYQEVYFGKSHCDISRVEKFTPS